MTHISESCIVSQYDIVSQGQGQVTQSDYCQKVYKSPATHVLWVILHVAFDGYSNFHNLTPYNDPQVKVRSQKVTDGKGSTKAMRHMYGLFYTYNSIVAVIFTP